MEPQTKKCGSCRRGECRRCIRYDTPLTQKIYECDCHVDLRKPWPVTWNGPRGARPRRAPQC